MTKAIIDLANTSFSMSEVINNLSKTVFVSKDKKTGIHPIPQSVADFGVVFVGDVPDEEIIISLTAPTTTLFRCPNTWRWPQILKALGVFQSTSQAVKNGWNQDVVDGWDEKMVRINKIRGSIATFREIPKWDPTPTVNLTVFKDFEVEDISFGGLKKPN